MLERNWTVHVRMPVNGYNCFLVVVLFICFNSLLLFLSNKNIDISLEYWSDWTNSDWLRLITATNLNSIPTSNQPKALWDNWCCSFLVPPPAPSPCDLEWRSSLPSPVSKCYHDTKSSCTYHNTKSSCTYHNTKSSCTYHDIKSSCTYHETKSSCTYRDTKSSCTCHDTKFEQNWFINIQCYNFWCSL